MPSSRYGGGIPQRWQGTYTIRLFCALLNAMPLCDCPYAIVLWDHALLRSPSTMPLRDVLVRYPCAAVRYPCAIPLRDFLVQCLYASALCGAIVQYPCAMPLCCTLVGRLHDGFLCCGGHLVALSDSLVRAMLLCNALVR